MVPGIKIPGVAESAGRQSLFRDWIFPAIEWLNSVPLAGLTLVVALGFTLGRRSIRGLALGPAGGTLLVALLLGWLGLDLDHMYGDDPQLTIGDFGFALFIYSVGFEAGPRFFSALLGGPGWRFVVLAILVNSFALLVAVGCGLWFSLGDSVTAGVLSGALTSPPTYAAAEAVCSDPAALSVVFALTYPIGLSGLVLLIEVLPRMLGTDLREVTTKEQERQKIQGVEMTRAFVVKNEDVIGRTLKELDLSHRSGCWITAVHRGAEIDPPRADTELLAGDHLMVRGRLEELQAFAAIVGPEVYDEELRARMPSPRRIVVLTSDGVGKTLRELGLPQQHRCMVSGVQRGEVFLEPHADLAIERGDVLQIVGRRDQIRDAAEKLGRLEKPTAETDIAVYAGGIFLGLMVAQLSISLGSFVLTPGVAGGLLLMGLLLGRFRRLGPLRTHVPLAARQLVRDLGILMFVAETGVRAGQSSFEPMRGVLGPAMLAGFITMAIPVILTVLCARFAFRKMPAAHVWGSIGGGMTSSASLVAIRRAADSDEPAIPYAAAYAVASVLVTMAGQLIVLIMR